MLILASWIFYIPISFRYQVTQRITKLAEFVAILQAHHVSVQQPNNIVENPVFDHLATCTGFKKMTKDSVWKKNNTFLKVSNKNHVIRMLISKVTPLWFVSFDSFDPETSTNFNPAMLFHRFFFQVKEEMNLRQYHPGILESPHQPLKIGLLGDCFPFGARPSWKGFCYVRFEKHICFFSTASLRSFSKLGMVYSFHMLE